MTKKDYSFAHLSFHLSEAGRLEALYRLLDTQWMAASFAHTGSRHAFAQDAERALWAAGQGESVDWVHLVRAGLLRASLGTHAARLPAKALGLLVRLGRARRALGEAALLKEPWYRARAYREIAEAFLDEGNREQAGEALKIALDAARQARGLEPDPLIDVALILVRVGDFDGAVIAGRWTEPASQGKGLATIGRALALAGEVDRALKLADELVSEDRIGILSSAVDRLMKRGNRKRAAQVAGEALKRARSSAAHEKLDMLFIAGRTLVRALGWHSALVKVRRIGFPDRLNLLAGAACEMGRIESPESAEDSARALLAAVEDAKDEPWTRILIQCARARLQARAGNPKLGRKTALVAAAEVHRHGEEYRKPYSVVLEVAETLVGLGESTEAFQLLKDETLSYEDQAEAVLEIVPAVALAGELPLALEALHEIGTARHLYDGLLRIVKALAQRGEIDQAKHLAQTSIYRLQEVAKAAFEHGEPERAGRILSRALSLIEPPSAPDLDLAYALGALAIALARSGTEEVAMVQRVAGDILEIADLLEEKSDQSEVVAKALCALIEIRDLQSAREEIEEIAQNVREASPFNYALAKEKVRLFLLAPTKANPLHGVPEWEDRLTILAEIAGDLAGAGQIDLAVKIAKLVLKGFKKLAPPSGEFESLTLAPWRTSLLSTLARVLAMAGKSTQAIGVAKQALALAGICEGEIDQPRAFAEAALALVAAGRRSEAIQAANRARDFLENMISLPGRKLDVLPEVAEAQAHVNGEAGLAWAGSIIRETRDADRRTRTLADLAWAAHKAGFPAQGMRMLCDAFTDAVLEAGERTGRSRALRVLEQGAPILARLDGGETLKRILEQVQDVSWWSFEESATPARGREDG